MLLAISLACSSCGFSTPKTKNFETNVEMFSFEILFSGIIFEMVAKYSKIVVIQKVSVVEELFNVAHDLTSFIIS